MTGSACLRFDDWPRPDRRLWDRLTLAGGPLDPVGPLGHLRASTLGIYQEQYGRWLAWSARQPDDLLSEDPIARASPEMGQAWIRSMNHLAPASRAMIAKGACIVLKAAAPDARWDAHRRLVGDLEREAAATRGVRKNGRILDSGVLLKAGLDLAGTRAAAAPTPLKAATLRRDGAAVSLLALLPLRLRAMIELELGQSFLQGAEGFIISLSREMTKIGVAWEAEVPSQVEDVLSRYIYEVRPWLMARQGEMHARLWVTGQGRPFGALYFSRRIREATFAATGIVVPPHFFRDSAATTLAKELPETARSVGPLLAHSGYRTAEQHYIHADPIDAGRDYAAVLDRFRRTSTPWRQLSSTPATRPRFRGRHRSRIRCGSAGRARRWMGWTSSTCSRTTRSAADTWQAARGCSRCWIARGKATSTSSWPRASTGSAGTKRMWRRSSSGCATPVCGA